MPAHTGTGPTDVLASAPLSDVWSCAEGRGLDALLVVLGSILLARFVAWIGNRVTDRIDRVAGSGDALVRSEAAKHRHSLTQVLTWTAIVLIYTIAAFFVLEL